MKKLFISQPMSGKADEEILAERKVAIKAAEELLREPVEVLPVSTGRSETTVVSWKVSGAFS